MPSTAVALLALSLILSYPPRAAGAPPHRTRLTPSIQSLQPNSTTIGVPNSFRGAEVQFFDLVVNGKHFEPRSVVLWQGRRVATRFVSATQLKASVPYSYLGINSLSKVKPNTPHGSGPRGMSAAGANGSTTVRVRNHNGHLSNRASFAIEYVVGGG
jgi:hypothetical protein